jgi:DNA-binding response OmpR family regulator
MQRLPKTSEIVRNHKILVVDDDRDILTVLQILLTQNNYIVESVFRWELINKSIDSFSPDLILLDISLAGADGRTICKTLKGNAGTKHIPIILFSANTNAEKSFQDYLASDFIAKPFEIDNLISKVMQHLPTKPSLA